MQWGVWPWGLALDMCNSPGASPPPRLHTHKTGWDAGFDDCSQIQLVVCYYNLEPAGWDFRILHGLGHRSLAVGRGLGEICWLFAVMGGVACEPPPGGTVKSLR